MTYPSMTTSKNTKLTARQQYVLRSLSQSGSASVSDWTVWYPLSGDQARPVIESLYRRGLVDVAGFSGRSRTYHVTEKGEAAIEELDGAA